jgi:hypothetical protein
MSGKQGKRNSTLVTLALGAAFGLAACGQDCFEAKRMGDFEYSQGNYSGAIGHYKRALKENPDCAGVKEKMAEAEGRSR